MLTPERKTILVSSSTAILLSITKLTVWILTWSMTIIASATDSVLDFFVSMANYFVLKKSERKSDHKYNFGYGKIQWFGALFEWLVIIWSGCYIIFLSIQKIITRDIFTEIDRPVYVMLFSIVLTWLLVAFMTKMLKKTKNLIIKSDLLHYKSDLLTNIGIIVALIFIKISWWTLFDPIISILIAIYIIIWSLKILNEWYEMLVDRCLDEEQIAQIRKIINHTSDKISGYHLLRTRKSWNETFIEFHLVFNEKINLVDAHDIATQVEDKIKVKIPGSNVQTHLDPYNDLAEEI